MADKIIRKSCPSCVTMAIFYECIIPIARTRKSQPCVRQSVVTVARHLFYLNALTWSRCVIEYNIYYVHVICVYKYIVAVYINIRVYAQYAPYSIVIYMYMYILCTIYKFSLYTRVTDTNFIFNIHSPARMLHTTCTYIIRI